MTKPRHWDPTPFVPGTYGLWVQTEVETVNTITIISGSPELKE